MIVVGFSWVKPGRNLVLFETARTPYHVIIDIGDDNLTTCIKSDIHYGRY